jgi:hypothetical protein
MSLDDYYGGRRTRTLISDGDSIERRGSWENLIGALLKTRLGTEASAAELELRDQLEGACGGPCEDAAALCLLARAPVRPEDIAGLT